MKINKKLSKLVNFKQNLELPIHRWFNIKEGYASKLVELFIEKEEIKKGFVVDFFSGSGTTALVAKQKGLKYFGMEINPFLFLLSKVKLNDYNGKDIVNLKKIKNTLYNNNKEKKQELKLSISKKVFSKNYSNLILLRNNILSLKKKKYRDFFIIALCCILEEVGTAKKDGNGLKYPKSKEVRELKECFEAHFKKMIKDIELSEQVRDPESAIIKADSRKISKNQMNKIKGKAGLVIFSPPYANCFDYTEVYKLELWVSGQIQDYENLKKIRENSLSSHLNKKYLQTKPHKLLEQQINKLDKKKLWNNKIVYMLSEYFFDMEKVLKNAHKALKNKGGCVVVVGNSAYTGTVIETDKILCKIAKQVGFSSTKIKVARKLRASSQQSKILSSKNNNLRESVLILKK